MIIREALERVQRDRPGEATEAELLKWLRDADTKWEDEVLETHWLQPRELTDAGLKGLHGERLSDQAKILYVALQSENPAWDVYFQPWDDTIMGGTRGMPVFRWPGFDVNKKVYGGAFHTTDDDAQTEIRVRTSAGQEETQVVIESADADVSAWQEDDGRVLIGWGNRNPSYADHATIVMDVGGYTITVWRYMDKAAGTYDGTVEGDTFTLSHDMKDAELLIPSPDDEVYIYWLYAHIDMRLGELDRYNNDALLYNNAWSQAAKRFNREHMPRGRQLHHMAYGSLPVPRGGEDPLDQRRWAPWWR